MQIKFTKGDFMRNFFMKKALSFLTIATLSIVSVVGCSPSTPASSETPESKPSQTSAKQDEDKDLVVVRYGSHCANEEDPNYKDPVTGEYRMDEETRQIKLKALEKVKEELGVDYQFVQYPGDVTEVLLQSVMANDPLCDIARISQGSQGTVLGQNVLQPIDAYIDLVPEPPIKIYDKYYFLSIGGGKWNSLSPLMYNISYIEQVPALKENGKTIYPSDLYKSGDWTWSTFKDYLQKINAYYANSQAPERPENRIDAYQTEYREAALLAIHSAGGSIYGENGLSVDSPETLEAVKFIEDLIDNNLLTANLVEGTSQTEANVHGTAFEKGESVFTNFHDWRSSSISSKLAERGESLGYIPFPRPDHMAFDDPAYRQARTGGESYGIVRGIDEEVVPLAIQAFLLYNETVDKLTDAQKAEETSNAPKNPHVTMDLFHAEVGEDMRNIYWDSVNKTEVNEISDMLGMDSIFYEIMGDALFGIGGSPSYDVAIQSKKSKITEKIEAMETLLSSDQVKDNVGPKFTQIEEEKYAFPIGTDLSSMDFLSHFEATDNLDGSLDISKAQVDYSAVDPHTAGIYEEGLKISIKDSSDNTGTGKYRVVIYDPTNEAPPILTLKAEYPALKIDQDTSTIQWKNNFIDQLTDATGLPLDDVTADLSQLDTSTAGTYPVTLTATDYLGHTTDVELEVTVE